MLPCMRKQRLGRFGPLLSVLGLHWPAPLPVVDAARRAGVNWLALDSTTAGGGLAPAGWAAVLVGADVRIEQILSTLGRDAVDVVLARDFDEWQAAVVLADARLARCAGVVTDDPAVVEACRRQRHVDAVWASGAAGDALAGMCRWGGTGLLHEVDVLTAEQVVGLEVSNLPSPGVP